MDVQSSPAARKPRLPRYTWLALAGLLIVILVAVLASQGVGRKPPSALDQGLDALTGDERFDLFGWEVSAVRSKLGDLVSNPAAGLSPEAARAAVLDYLDQAKHAAQLQDEIEAIYSDPDQLDPEGATQELRDELAALHAELAAQAPTVEAVLERQLSQRLDALDLDVAGVVWPPPRFTFTDSPDLLVVSPRDRITRLRSIDLVPDLDSEDRSEMEQAVRDQFDLSGYVTATGGYGTWPTMVVNQFGLPWSAETIAHEWVHNYLAFHSLGWADLSGDSEAITINETVASIVGREVGRDLLATYYPDLLPPEPSPTTQVRPLAEPEEPAQFDFGQEMRATRLAVDAMLEKGLVDEAEAFMEARRQTFVEHGYPLRVLNQAYFAFHGSYATGPGATDPTGPKLERLRALSSSLADFLRLVDGMTSVADLDAALQRLEQPAGS